MADLTLIIGNKNYSSWSFRPWLALKAAGLKFDEIRIPLRRADTKQRLLAYSPSGKAPALLHKSLVVWDSLAICEYVAELCPEANLWPSESGARAVARSMAMEMHSGFAALRENLPMDLTRDQRRFSRADFARDDIHRIVSLWSEARQRWSASGPFLFGQFGIVDAMFAPVVSRFRTYGVVVEGACAAYMDAVLQWPAFREWEAEAAKEVEVIEYDILKKPGS